MKSDEIKENQSSLINRRSFLKIISGIFTGFIALTLGIPMIETLVGTISKNTGRTFSKVASINSISDNYPVNLSFLITEEDAFIKNKVEHQVWAVKRPGSDITVFSPICPHLGCRYEWDSNRNFFICPCHHSVFNIEGKLISGPSPRPLDTLPQKIENDNLFVLWERFKPGIARKERV